MKHPWQSSCLRASRLVLAALLLSATTMGCIHSSVNASPGLRWWMFSSYGAQRICPALLQQGIGLRMSDNAPVTGRFHPNQCAVRIDDRSNTIVVSLAGTGYAYTPVSQRVGFSMSAAVRYRPDFRMVGDDVYVWGLFDRLVTGPSFRVDYVENPAGAFVRGPLAMIGSTVGDGIVRRQLTRGFTVVHNDRGNHFGLGAVRPPFKPHDPLSPFSHRGARYTFANETVLVHPHQRDYLGPFQITEPGQRLLLQCLVTGAPVDVLVVSRAGGDAWRESYRRGHLSPPLGSVLASSVPTPTIGFTTFYQLPVGEHYVVIDHTAQAGRVAPSQLPFGPLGLAAQVSYTVQLVE